MNTCLNGIINGNAEKDLSPIAAMRKSIWLVASYTRLSREDGVAGESNSIATQRKMIAEWAASQDNVLLVAEYSDDGYSGATFDRPGFNQMMEDARRGIFNTIAVKDLSRFGRSYLDCGNLIERDLPRLGIRLYSVVDGFDSMKSWDFDTALLLPMKNLMNEMQVITTSQKVRASLKAKRSRGEFVSNFAPYGYRKDPHDKHQLIIDPEAAKTVKRIFELRIAGSSASAIARTLNGEGILSPAEYKRSCGLNYHTGFSRTGQSVWHAKSVLRILNDETYTGTLLQGKTRRRNWRSRIITPVPRDEQSFVAHAHEAIVTADAFRLASQAMVDNRRDISFTGIYADANFSDWNGLDAMLRYYRKRVLCQDCRKRLSRLSVKSRGHPYVYYSCSSHRHNSRVCSPHSIREEKLLSELIRILSEIAQRDDVHELEKHETVFVVDAIGSVRFEIL